MDEVNQNPFPPQEPPIPQVTFPQSPAMKPYETGGREQRLLLLLGILSIILVDRLFFGDGNLGFALSCSAVILLSFLYLRRCGYRTNAYSGALLALAMVLAASFMRSRDGGVKFISFCMMLLAANLGLCLMAGQNTREAGELRSLLDAGRAMLSLGIGKLTPAFSGLKVSVEQDAAKGKKSRAVLIGLLIALPLVLVVTLLLSSADAAFEGLLEKLPQIDINRIIPDLIFAAMLAPVLYTRAVALHAAKRGEPEAIRKKIWNSVTVNTVLGAVCLVYGAYLVSQLAYLMGGFWGILPEEYTAAEYARRGFFEMACLCGINLSLMLLAPAHSDREAPGYRLTRWLCLGIGLVSLFLVICASAKMLLYIRLLGLTRLRVLTEVVMLGLGVGTVLVSLWLFRPRFPYMKGAVLTALVLCAAVAWVDVDTLVAGYNVRAYQFGVLERVDVHYLSTLSDGAIPYIAQLTQDSDPVVANAAREYLEDWADEETRDWTITDIAADPYRE